MNYLGVSVFHKDKNKASVPLNQVKSKNTDKLYRCVIPKQLIITEKRAEIIKPYRGLMGFENARYDSLCDTLLINLANYLQDLPETRNSYFSSRGGFLNHAFSRCSAALTAARAYFVNEEGLPAKLLSDEQQLWMYALFTAALLKGIGKIYVDFNVELFDNKGEFIGQWQVFDGPMRDQHAYFYDYDFDVPYQEIFRHRVTLMLARQVMPKEGYLWLASNKDVLSIWLALLEDDSRSAGTLGMILDKADALAINRFFHERTLQGYHHEGEGNPLQQKKTTFNLPQRELSDLMKEGKIPQAGIEFVKWLNRSLLTARVMVNQAPLFMVPGGLLMSPDVFKLFIREHPQFKNWQTVQSAFVQMQLHTTNDRGDVIQRFNQNKSGQTHSGVVLSNVSVVLPDKVKVVNLSNGTVKEVTAANLSNTKMSAQYFSQATHQASTHQTLSQTGKWQAPTENGKPPVNPTQKG
jgi:hypothetical protein